MSKTYTPYDQTTGLFDRVQYQLDEDLVESHTPEGHAMMEGAFDHLAVCVNLETLEVVPRTIPPQGSHAVEWHMDPEIQRWVPKPTLEVRTIQTRQIRNKLLEESDLAVLRAYEKGTPVAQEWIDYRQALRDLPTVQGFPDNVELPTKPSTM